ncbi:transglycosylase domain-containing protein [Deinococcus aetherius]|nr:transglycosylase domain-containing protein [Deinococcus aetherius]
MRFFTGLGVLLLLGTAGAGGLWWMWGRDLPSVGDLDVLEFSGQTRVYDRAGKLVGTLTPTLGSGESVNRHLLQLGEISPTLQKAIVTSEDRRFYEHHGVDYIGIARGLFKGIFENDLEGGSSITQQVIKNTLLADLRSARTPERKFKEGVLAYQLERSFNKQQILGAYLNVIYWGDGGRSDIVGAETAARAYFRKSASDLNLAESVYLTTLVPAPNKRYRDFKAYRPLMRNLLDRMVEDGRITRGQANLAWRTPIYPAGWRIGWNDDGTVRSAVLERPGRLQENMPRPPVQTGFHYLQAVERELIPVIGRKALYGGGKVFTGMDLQAQQSAEQASLNARLPEGATLGIALVNPQNGEALALVGQKLTGGRPGDWNNATQARRQVGSSIKPLLYTLALEKGWKQSDVVLDSPIEGDYQPQNYDGRWTGRYVTMRYALDHSLNLPTVRIAQEIGLNTFEAKLRDLGLDPPANAGLPLSIGTLEASPLQMAAAYAPFANGGLYYRPSLVRRAEDERGQVLYTRPVPQGKRVWDARTAWLGLDMIRGVVNDLTEYQGGLATRAQIPSWDVGGKTGTTNDVKDLWFAGVTPLVSGAVWVGKQAGGALPGWAYSGEIPTPVWQQAVAGTLAGRSPQPFREPGGVAYQVVRQVEMAFREEEQGTEQVAHDGSRRENGGGGFFGRRNRYTVPAPAPEPQPEVVTPEEPAPEVPADAFPQTEPPVGEAPNDGTVTGDQGGFGGGTAEVAPPPEPLPETPPAEESAPIDLGLTATPPTEPEPLPEVVPDSGTPGDGSEFSEPSSQFDGFPQDDGGADGTQTAPPTY